MTPLAAAAVLAPAGLFVILAAALFGASWPEPVEIAVAWIGFLISSTGAVALAAWLIHALWPLLTARSLLGGGLL